jgi:hypothetical protein
MPSRRAPTRWTSDIAFVEPACGAMARRRVFLIFTPFANIARTYIVPPPRFVGIFEGSILKMNWYLEVFKKTGCKAERYWCESDFSKVVAQVKAARKDSDHILRLLGPYNAPVTQLRELESLGARRDLA